MSTKRTSISICQLIRFKLLTVIGVVGLLLSAVPLRAQEITEIIHAGLVSPHGVAVDAAGNTYVVGNESDNVFKIEPGGTITEIIDSSGDGSGNTLSGPTGIAVDGSGNVYVAGGSNAFKIEPGGTITEIIDSTGDGSGNTLSNSRSIAVDGSGNVYVAGISSYNAFKIEPGGTITEIIDATGDGSGNSLFDPSRIAVDGSGNVFVAGSRSHNAFKIALGTPAIASSVLLVDVDATGLDDGSSFINAFSNLQDALAEADVRNTDVDTLNDISEIWVADGCSISTTTAHFLLLIGHNSLISL